jgi:hypothetical protein
MEAIPFWNEVVNMGSMVQKKGFGPGVLRP